MSSSKKAVLNIFKNGDPVDAAFGLVKDAPYFPATVRETRLLEGTQYLDVRYDDGSSQVGVPAELCKARAGKGKAVGRPAPPEDPVCMVCLGDGEGEGWICDGCGALEHSECFVIKLPKGKRLNEHDKWLCDRCHMEVRAHNTKLASTGEPELSKKEGLDFAKAASESYGCALCPEKGANLGYFLRVPADLGCAEPWVHHLCAQFMPGLCIKWNDAPEWDHCDDKGHGGGLVCGWDSAILLDRCTQKCSVCGLADGCTVKCIVPRFSSCFTESVRSCRLDFTPCCPVHLHLLPWLLNLVSLSSVLSPL